MEDKPHKNIRGKEYYTQTTGEVTQHEPLQQTPIQRLREFVKWAQTQGLCKGEYDFERICRLSPKYISNNIHTGKGNIGTEMLGRIISVFPQLNLAWICTGNGLMLTFTDSDDISNMDYKQAYESAMMQIEALNKIIKKFQT